LNELFGGLIEIAGERMVNALYLPNQKPMTASSARLNLLTRFGDIKAFLDPVESGINSDN